MALWSLGKKKEKNLFSINFISISLLCNFKWLKYIKNANNRRIRTKYVRYLAKILKQVLQIYHEKISFIYLGTHVVGINILPTVSV